MRIGVRTKRRPETITLNLASMIDLTFLLLIYFMVTTVIATPEDRLSPTLQTRSESAIGPTVDFQPQIVEVFREGDRGVFRIGSAVLSDRGSLLDALSRLHLPAGVFVRGTDDAPVSAVAAAIQACRDAGFEQVTYVPASG